jgi:hypothetical protein
LVDLRRASPILGRQVVRDGRLLLDRDRYQALDPAIMRAIAEKHLADLHTFAARVLDHLGMK